MAVSGVSGTDSSAYSNSTSATSSSASKSDASTLTLNGFYKLLAAQLQNQSMYDSTDNSQYITQMVQFAMLSQMQSMTNSVDSSTALSMVGKTVSLSSTNTDGTTTKSSGAVESVTFESGTPYLHVNGGYYKLSDVTAVSNESKT